MDNKKYKLNGKTISNLGILSLVKDKIKEVEEYVKDGNYIDIKKEDIETLEFLVSKLKK